MILSDRRIKVTLYYGQDELSTYQAAQSLAQIITGVQEVERGISAVESSNQGSPSTACQARESGQLKRRNPPTVIQLTHAEVSRPMQGLCLCCRMHTELSHLLREAFMQALQKKRTPFSHIIVCARSDTDPANIVHTLNNDFFLKERYVFWDVVSCLALAQLLLLVEQMDQQVLQQPLSARQTNAAKRDAGKRDAAKRDAGKRDAAKRDVGKRDVGKMNPQEPEQSMDQWQNWALKRSQLFATDLFLLDQQEKATDLDIVMNTLKATDVDVVTNALLESLQSMRVDAAVWHRPDIHFRQRFDQLAYQKYMTDLLVREQNQQRIAHRPVAGRLFSTGLFA